MVSNGNDFGQCSGHSSLGMVWVARVKGSSLEAGSPVRTALALGGLPLSRVSLAAECVLEMIIFPAGLTKLETTLRRPRLVITPLQKDGFCQNTHLTSAMQYLERERENREKQ